ncbi:P-type ATPase-like protein [Spinellus fusiger]|nr:P-type ATPase-like protein [Spinellus fusiger]
MHTLPIATTSQEIPLRIKSQRKQTVGSYSSRGRSGLYRRRYNIQDQVTESESGRSDVELNTSDEHVGESDSSDSNSSSSEDEDDDNDDDTKTKSFFSPVRESNRIERTFTNETRHQKLLLTEEDVEVDIEGYRYNTLRLIIYRVACVLTLGLVWIICRWVPKWKVAWVGYSVNLEDAEWLVFTNQYGDQQVISPVHKRLQCTIGSVFSLEQIKRELADTSLDQSKHASLLAMNKTLEWVTLVEYRYVRLAFHPILHKFLIVGFWKDHSWTVVKGLKSGLTSKKWEERLSVFGTNLIDIHEKSTLKLLTDEVLDPFYVFQIASIILWCMDDYYYYAFCIFIISAVSVITTLIETIHTTKKMREMSRFKCDVRVFRSGGWRTVNSIELVPGDLININDLHTVPCDAMLISGDCMVNESMLTGESVPVSKAPITDITLRKVNLSNDSIPAEVSKHFLFMGTKIIRVREDENCTTASAIVVRTGFNTAKGALIRSMLFPKPTSFTFYRDSYLFIGVLAIIAVFGFLLSSVNFIRLGIDYGTMMLRALDLITIVVPPALPATMSIGTNFAIQRLKKKGIFCISPPKVNIGGKIDCMCFDKTGTLTEDGLDIHGIRAVKTQDNGIKKFDEESTSVTDIEANEECNNSTASRIFRTMTTCHSLKIVEGELLGDPLDLKMFEFTQWELEESEGVSSLGLKPRNEFSTSQAKKIAKIGIMPTVVRPPGGRHDLHLSPDSLNKPPIEFGIIHSFEFVSALRRMSVIVRQLAGPSMEVFVKGAPEVMVDICRPETMPADFQERLYWYTHRGYRVIACASRELKDIKWHKLHKLKRQDVECNLTFLGFIIFENKLKLHTKDAITTLRDAKIRQIMCTGDNVLTAVSVSRECGLVDQGSEIYIPKFLKGSSTEADSELVWESVLHEGNRLSGDTLQPRTQTSSYYHHPYGRAQGYYVAVTGEAFRWMVDYAPTELLYRMLVKGAIYARMSPDEKAELVTMLQNIGYCVGFCGDGANDCGALKAGDIGISLSEAEASVAAPFTSNTMDINCVIDVIKEGRAALVTSFSCFKYMALYSIIQFTSVTLLYAFGSNLGDFQFLYIDLFLILPIAVFMGYTAVWPHLYYKRPTASLVSKKVLTSLIGHIIINSGFQFLIYWTVHQQDWYEAPVFDPDGENIMCYENTALFSLSSFQYILVAIVFSVGPPYRKPLWTNGRFILTLTALGALTTWTLIYPHPFLKDLLELETLPLSFRAYILFIAALNFATSYTCERYLFPNLAGWISQSILWTRLKLLRQTEYMPVGKVHRKIYKRVNQEMES